jgi:hypothetical protein
LVALFGGLIKVQEPQRVDSITVIRGGLRRIFIAFCSFTGAAIASAGILEMPPYEM